MEEPAQRFPRSLAEETIDMVAQVIPVERVCRMTKVMFKAKFNLGTDLIA